MGHDMEYPTMLYLGTARHTPMMVIYKILAEYFIYGDSCPKIHGENTVSMPYCL